jgi:hypothetical protein
MKNLLVVCDNADQILIVDYTKALTDTDPDSDNYGTPFFAAGECKDYFDIHIHSFNGAKGEAQRLLSEWQTVSRNQNFVNPSVTVLEICTEETRYRVTRDMPDWIVAYVDYIDPLKDREPKPEPAMQYINRRESDGALWPTMFPITSPGWVQIAAHPINNRHEVGDTVLIYDRFPKPEGRMERGTVVNTLHRPDNRTWIKFENAFEDAIADECVINFSKGDHLSDAEKGEAMGMATETTIVQ